MGRGLGGALMPQAVAAWAVTAFGVTGTAATIVSFAVQAVVSSALSAVVGKLLAPSKPDGTLDNARMSTTVRQSAAPRRLIYGEVKTGGVLAYPAQPVNGDCHLATYIGEGPIESVDPIFFLGEDLNSDPKFAGLLQLVPYLGAAGQVASAELIAASGGEWTTDHVGHGCAWVHTRYKFTRNAFPQGLVFPAFTVRGRLLFDPRTGLHTWSSNPALVVLDYVRSEFGYGAPDMWIDFDSFAAAAAVCDEVLVSIDPTNIVDGVPGRIRRYSLNGVFEVDSGPAKNLQAMEAACGGKLVFSGGKYRFYAGAWRAPTGPVLTGEFLRGVPKLRTHPGRQQRCNIARGTYREPKQDWQATDFAEQRLADAVIAEDGEIVQPLQLSAVTNGAQAQRLARLAMMRARSAVPLVLECNWAAFAWRLYDTVQVNLPEVGADGIYLIGGYTFPEGGGINLSLVPQPAEDFVWVPEVHEEMVPVVVRPDFNSTPPAVTGLAAVGTADGGTGIGGITVTWDATPDVFFDHYDIEIKDVLESDWGAAPTGPWADRLRWVTNRYVYTDIPPGDEYEIRVRVERTDGTYGPWVTTDPVLVEGDEEAPPDPTSLSVTGSGTLTIAWTTPDTSDFRRSNVYTNTSMSPIGATLLTSITGARNTAVSTTHTPGALRYYYVSAQDATGNESALTYAGSGS